MGEKEYYKQVKYDIQKFKKKNDAWWHVSAITENPSIRKDANHILGINKTSGIKPNPQNYEFKSSGAEHVSVKKDEEGYYVVKYLSSSKNFNFIVRELAKNGEITKEDVINNKNIVGMDKTEILQTYEFKPEKPTTKPPIPIEEKLNQGLKPKEEITSEQFDRIERDIKEGIEESGDTFRGSMLLKKVYSAMNDKEEDDITWVKGYLKELDKDDAEIARIEDERRKSLEESVKREEEKQALYWSNIAKGESTNYRYQAFLDTVEDPSKITSNAEYQAWIVLLMILKKFTETLP